MTQAKGQQAKWWTKLVVQATKTAVEVMLCEHVKQSKCALDLANLAEVATAAQTLVTMNTFLVQLLALEIRCYSWTCALLNHALTKIPYLYHGGGNNACSIAQRCQCNQWDLPPQANRL